MKEEAKTTETVPQTLFIITGWIRQGVSCIDGARSIRLFNMTESIGRSVRVLRDKYEYCQEECIKVTLHTCAACLCCMPILLKDLRSGPRKKEPETRKKKVKVCVSGTGLAEL